MPAYQQHMFGLWRRTPICLHILIHASVVTSVMPNISIQGEIIFFITLKNKVCQYKEMLPTISRIECVEYKGTL